MGISQIDEWKRATMRTGARWCLLIARSGRSFNTANPRLRYPPQRDNNNDTCNTGRRAHRTTNAVTADSLRVPPRDTPPTTSTLGPEEGSDFTGLAVAQLDTHPPQPPPSSLLRCHFCSECVCVFTDRHPPEAAQNATSDATTHHRPAFQNPRY